MRRLSLILALAFFLALLPGCREQNKADIAATTLPVYEFTLRLTDGTGLGVSRLVTESVSCLHDYSLQVSQMQTIEAAKVVVISGGGLEGFLESALHGASAVIDASQGISLLCGEGHDHEPQEEDHHHEVDPHIWLSPENGKAMAKNICQGLSRQFPQYAQVFEKNLPGLLADLDALQAYGEAQLSSLSRRELITFHDGFAYFALAFDLTILEAVEEEAGSETSAAQLISLIGLVEGQQLPAIFTETNGSTASARIIAAETGCQLFALDMAMAGESYFDAMYHNIDTIKEALG